MASLAEVLAQSGFTKEQISALDAKLIQSLDGYVSTASDSLTKAEAERRAAAERAAAADEAQRKAQETLDRVQLEGRSNVEFYEQKIVPGLTTAEQQQKDILSRLANAEALAAFYRTQNEKAREGGFIAADAPGFTAPVAPAGDPSTQRDSSGRYVAGTGGSPTFIANGGFDPDSFKRDAVSSIAELEDLRWKYQSLYGTPMPIAPTELIRQADSQKLSPSAYASKIFNFAQKEEEQRQASLQKNMDEYAAQKVAEKEEAHKAELKRIQDEYAAKTRQAMEQGGNNPDVRRVQDTKFAEVKRAVAEGTRPDPLKMTDAQRRAATRNLIHSEIVERDMAGAGV